MNISTKAEKDLLTERYSSKIEGLLSCYDRIIISGSLPDCCHPQAMMNQMYSRGKLYKDYTLFANEMREELRENAKKISEQEGIQLQFVNNRDRKESLVADIIKKRGNAEGLVCILTAMETCTAYKYSYNRESGKSGLKFSSSKCLHYYFYIIDKEFGLCYLRVPTWAPFRLQFYCNGHEWLAGQMKKQGIKFKQLDNTFVKIDDYEKAQNISDLFDVKLLHKKLDQWAKKYCPVHREFPSGYHWSIMQVEYATDIVFKNAKSLKPIYQEILRTAIIEVKAEDIYKFAGKKLHALSKQEVNSRLNTLIEGTRIKHQVGPMSIKMYDKQGIVLRIETVTNNVSFFKHYREVIHRNGKSEMKMAPLKKSLYSLFGLHGLMRAVNLRYLKFISFMEDNSQGRVKLEKICESKRDEKDRSYRAINLFYQEDLKLIIALLNGEHILGGITNKSLRMKLMGWSSGKVSRALRRLKVYGLIKKTRDSYKYYMTRFGQKILLSVLKLKERIIIPILCNAHV